MNENQKTILNLILCFFLGVAITLAITIPIYISRARRANIESAELSVRLSEANRRLAEADSRIGECRESFERIAESATASNGTLTGIIESLKRIRDEVQVMEERFYSIDNNSDNNNGFDSLHVEAVE